MMRPRAGMMRLALSGLGACWVVLAIPGPAAADGDIRASYAVTLVGLPLANATLDLAVRGNVYTARVTYQSAGATRLLSDAAGVAASSGAYRDGRLIPAGFDLDYRNGRRRQKVTLGMTEGVVKTMTIDPPLELTSDQPAIEAKHLNAVADPLSALLIPAGRGEDKAQIDACDRTLSILDGLRRYDVRLELQATGSTDRKGFSGPTTTCRVVLKPLAGRIGGGANARAAGADPSQIEVTYGRAVTLDLHVPISLRAQTRYGAVSVALREFADGGPKPGAPR
ncbi:DUF3108 domain-containing protein [Bradyrhizobium japonicum]|nr:DUF3108 domain-containing protein [Bradyrhizobium japonicum]